MSWRRSTHADSSSTGTSTSRSVSAPSLFQLVESAV